MTLDYDRYLPHLDQYDIPEGQKRELIAVVYGFMEGFVDTAFGIHPVQTCQNLDERRISKSSAKIVGSNHENLTTKFKHAAHLRQKDQP